VQARDGKETWIYNTFGNKLIFGQLLIMCFVYLSEKLIVFFSAFLHRKAAYRELCGVHVIVGL